MGHLFRLSDAQWAVIKPLNVRFAQLNNWCAAAPHVRNPPDLPDAPTGSMKFWHCCECPLCPHTGRRIAKYAAPRSNDCKGEIALWFMTAGYAIEPNR
nr:hypothetical protein [uncultured Cohaesibacter sp.]